MNNEKLNILKCFPPQKLDLLSYALLLILIPTKEDVFIDVISSLKNSRGFSFNNFLFIFF